MSFNWLQKQKKEPACCSRSPIKISTDTTTEPPTSDSCRISGQAELWTHPKENRDGGDELLRLRQSTHCGFSTGTENNIRQSNNNVMTPEESNGLIEKLEADEVFRVRVLTSNSIEECMAIVEAKSINCSAHELIDMLENYIKKYAINTFWNRSIWGNKIA
ncbi:hypothetical protein G9409_08975 [Chlorobium sp. BLA1]|nr:hypothetical protein [Candidatus Chlorobium masyuteum]NTU45345.1 hypothetical protein [Chlorobiaceae bacterium]